MTDSKSNQPRGKSRLLSRDELVEALRLADSQARRGSLATNEPTFYAAAADEIERPTAELAEALRVCSEWGAKEYTARIERDRLELLYNLECEHSKRLRAELSALDSKTGSELNRLRAALARIAVMGEQGMQPDYTKWVTFHDEIARIAREALAGSDSQK